MRLEFDFETGRVQHRFQLGSSVSTEMPGNNVFSGPKNFPSRNRAKKQTAHWHRIAETLQKGYIVFDMFEDIESSSCLD
ncbi:MAG: hypothetical protein SynsKO_20220 [Synoicihabitans sp.]